MIFGVSGNPPPPPPPRGMKKKELEKVTSHGTLTIVRMEIERALFHTL